MSGIVGIVNLNGDLVDAKELECLTGSLSRTAPDAQSIWADGNVGLGHSLLQTDLDEEFRNQPCSINKQIWLTSDARIDNRKELVRAIEAQLGSEGARYPTPRSDAELILTSYQAWGTDCVEHLIGDFAFAIWDARLRQLFCARDHLGVKQFYYAHNNDCFVFSNSLNCLRLHSSVSSKLNEVAIGDFFLFGLNQDPASTTFTDIRRLPQAHSLIVSASGLKLQKYWTPKVGELKYKSAQDYVERFRELLADAVSDRLRTSSVGISMSGGLDSAAVAAIAAERQQGALDLRAYCVVYDRVFHDEERSYAKLVADKIGIPIEFLEGDLINQGGNARTEGIAPEPHYVDPIYVVSDHLLSLIAARGRVALTGWDGDTFMNESPRHLFKWLFENGQLWELVTKLAHYSVVERRPPPIGLRTFIRRWQDPFWNSSPFPNWIDEEFSRKLKLVDRWRSVNSKSEVADKLRPRAFETMFSPSWSALLGRFDPGVTQLSLEVRHPIIDIRVIEYLLALPVIPWLLDKRILREAMIDKLPERVRLRPKAPLADDPGVHLRYSKKFRDIDLFRPVPAFLNYIDRNAIPPVAEETDRNRLWNNLRPYSFNEWLRKVYFPNGDSNDK